MKLPPSTGFHTVSYCHYPNNLWIIKVGVEKWTLPVQVISLCTGCMGNGVRESQYSGEGALRWPSERATEVWFITKALYKCLINLLIHSTFVFGEASRESWNYYPSRLDLDFVAKKKVNIKMQLHCTFEHLFDWIQWHIKTFNECYIQVKKKLQK